MTNLRNKALEIKFYLRHFSNPNVKIKKILTLNQNRGTFFCFVEKVPGMELL